ncbi:hypothetical protein [Cochleicola gelatinilyticus]|uniref:Outer membrane protein n=1 Tax=Cochleicola gelatinilyticus TaxID=1763537 RepID=A0A167IM99_9FLAO|nr:hypothetical protein [Cochleicola gelatinilyticus]OAB79819.1 hypothetical protein ULVI_03495 [Cochleicola gelatinilyticus]
MLKHIIIAVFIVITGATTFAQEGTSSPYSYYGIGLPKFKGTAENRSMGGISILSDSIHLNLQNPASIADLRLVNFTVGASHKSFTQETSSDSQKTSATTLDYLAVGVPLSPKFGGSFGLIPYSSVGYSVLNENSEGFSTFEGEGGLNKAFINLGYKITPELSVGIDANYNFGKIENDSFTRINDAEFGTRESNRSDLLGFSYNFGAQYKTMVSENLQLSTSLSYTPETSFTSENSREIAAIVITGTGQIAEADVRNVPVDDTEFTFPSQYTIGVGIGKPKSWFAGLEYQDQKTSNFTNRALDIDDVSFNDATKIRLGGYYIPNYNSFGNYAKRIVYRGGFRMEETGITVRGEEINEFGISFGVGLPVGRLFSNANLGFEYGQRGTTNSGLVQENFFNVFLSLSLNDKWFEKRYID